MVATASVTTRRADLLINPRQLAVVQWSYTAPLITTLKNPTTGALVVPDNGYVVGAHRKATGGDLANAQTYNDIMVHGSGSPIMRIPTERRISIGVEPVETNRRNLGNWWGADYSGIIADAAGGVHLPVPSLPQNILSRVALIGRHDFNGLACYIVWVGNRVEVNETANSAVQDSEVVSYPYTFGFTDVEQLNSEPIFVEIFGPGWDAMQNNADAGFGTTLSALDVTPANATLDLSSGETQQLTAVDNNNVDRTTQATWVSGTPATATVNSAGVVTPVAVGTSVITGTYNTFSDTCNVTVVA